VVVAVAALERGDVSTDQPRLATLDPGIGVGQVRLAGPDRLDLCTGEDDARLERLVDRELMAGFSVEGDGHFVAHWRAPSDVGGDGRGGSIRPGARTPAHAGRRSSA
jgi:hypothetical protein